MPALAQFFCFSDYSGGHDLTFNITYTTNNKFSCVLFKTKTPLR